MKATDTAKTKRFTTKSLGAAAKRIITHQGRNTVVHLYLIHLLNYLTPALTVALLTRRLSPPGYGLLLIAQSLSFTVAMLTEYGFGWTASRAAAQLPSEDLGPLVSAVLASKLLISAASSAYIPVILLTVPSTRGHYVLLAVAFFYGTIQGLDLQWYFLGQQKLRGYVTFDTATRISSAILLYLLIHDDNDIPKVLAIQSVGAVALLSWSMWRITRGVSLEWPKWIAIKDAIKEGRTIFAQQIAGFASSNANITVLGMVTLPIEVGFFGAAEKIVRYLSSLSAPIMQFVYPKVNQHIGKSPEHANRLATVATAISIAMGGTMSLAITFAPRLIIGGLYGPKMLAAVPSLRVLAIFPVLNSTNRALFYYWLLPRRMEAKSLRAMAVAGVVNLISVSVLGRLWSGPGAASAVILTEVTTLALYLNALRELPRDANQQKIAA